MIHRQVFRSYQLMAEVTFPFLEPGFPPGRLPEFFSAPAFNSNMPLDGIIVT
jgi:hypothetical protein